MKEAGRMYVIGFAEEGDSSEKSWDDTAERIRKFLFSIAAKRLQKLFSGAFIKQEDLDIYLDPNSDVLLYRYGIPWSSGESLPDFGTPEEDRNKEKAADIAKLFMSYRPSKNPFGTYRFDNWNCEHFASFCHTTSLSVEELRQRIAALGEGESLSRKFLLDNSGARSIQAEHWIDEGKLIKRPGPIEDEIYDFSSDVEVYEVLNRDD